MGKVSETITKLLMLTSELRNPLQTYTHMSKTNTQLTKNTFVLKTSYGLSVTRDGTLRDLPSEQTSHRLVFQLEGKNVGEYSYLLASKEAHTSVYSCFFFFSFSPSLSLCLCICLSLYTISLSIYIHSCS